MPPELLPETQITNQVLDLIDRHAGENFMLTASWSPPHDLWVIPEPYYSLVDRDKVELPGSTDVPEWDRRDKLAKEKEVLGFYLCGHPLAEHRERLATYCSYTSSEAAGLRSRSEVTLGGMLSSIKYAHTKSSRPGTPTRYATFDLEDTAGTIRCILWPDQLGSYAHLLEQDVILVARGTIDKRPGSDEANLIVSELIALPDLAARCTRGVVIRLSEERHGQGKLEELHEVLRGYPGDCELQLLIDLTEGSRVCCTCDGLRVAVNDEMRGRVEQLLGPGNFRLLTAKPNAVASRR